jgi:hypothetical protein
MSQVMRHVLRNIWAYLFLAVSVFWLSLIGLVVLLIWLWEVICG